MALRILERFPLTSLLRTMNRAMVTSPDLLRHQLMVSREQLRYTILSEPRHQHVESLARFDQKVFSQTGADGILAEILTRIGVESKRFVEIGTEDGLETNTTFLLWQGWKGHWFEGSKEDVLSIQKTFHDPIANGRLKAIHAFVDAENINETLIAAEIPESPDVFSLDIDMNTLWVLKKIKTRPRVWIVEYNANIPPAIEWSVEYDPQSVWSGSHYFGASLKAYERWADSAGYQLVGCDLAGYNAFFVREDLCGNHFVRPSTAEQHYEPCRGAFAMSRSRLRPSFEQ